MKRVAFVVQRCGLEVNGGSEKHCLDVARRLVGRMNVEILTTSAMDYRSWDDHYPTGLGEVAGVPVRRFPVREPRDARFDELSSVIHARLADVGLDEAERWMRAQGPWSPDLFAWIAANRDEYAAFFFFTYLYATTYYGLPEVAERAFLVPTAHDEWPLRLPIWEHLFALPRAFLFNTPEERDMLRRRFPALSLPGPVVGVGVEAPPRTDPESFRRRFGIEGAFLLYVGRIEPAKGCDTMLREYARWRKRRPDAPPLVLIGKAFMRVPDVPGVIQTGFVDDQTKWNALAACSALLMPSPYESLSIALLEAWHAGRPVLVNGACDVLVGQTRRAQGGLWYRNADEFGLALDRLLDPRIGPTLGRQGSEFVAREVRWDRITDAYIELADGAEIPRA